MEFETRNELGTQAQMHLTALWYKVPTSNVLYSWKGPGSDPPKNSSVLVWVVP